MAQFGDFIARLFSSGGTLGLSGEGGSVFPAGPENAVYNDLLRKHRVEGDLVADPGLLWSGSGSVLRRRGGLVSHLLNQKNDSVAGFTDMLIVLSPMDWRRAQRELREPWVERASGLLRDRFEQFCIEEDYHLLFPQRRLGLRLMEDGCTEMGGALIGLRPGEFVTGLLPNLYTGSTGGAHAIVAVYVHLPRIWEGYREVGRLWSDQLQFTLGCHWLDNFHDASLQRPSLYRLQQYGDGSLVHVIHPDLQDRYRVSSHTSPDGTSILTLLDALDEPVVHLILALVEDQPGGAPSNSRITQPPRKPQIDLPPGPALPDSLAGGGHRTVVPLDLDERIFRLRERGVLFQKVHFNKFMDGYDVYVSPDGTVGTSLSDRAATFQIRGRVVNLVVHRPGIHVDGMTLSPNAVLRLDSNTRIALGSQTIEYVDLSHIDAEGWPYLGEVRRNGGSVSMVFGGIYKIGRDRTVKVRLPDEPENDNIVWLPGIAEGTTIRSRTGEIPKSRFYTDSIMVASQHAEIDLSDEPTLKSMARNCYTYVRRGDEVVALRPADKNDGNVATKIQAGDEILVGNCVFEVAFAPETHDESVPVPAIGAIPSLPLIPAVPTLPTPIGADDLPAAAGLGESGPPPVAPRFDLSFESLFEEEDRGGPAQFALAGAGPTDYGETPSAPKKEGPRLVLRQGPATPRPPQSSGPNAGTIAPDATWVVAEDDWQLELSRPARLLLAGWMVHGEVMVGNHRGVLVGIPECSTHPEQIFQPINYFSLSVRGAKAQARRLDRSDARLLVAGQLVNETGELDRATLVIVKRDRKGDPDFEIALTLRQDNQLPDPRAQLLAPDLSDRMVRGLFVLGLPLRAPRAVELGPIRGVVHFDGQGLVFQSYLASYQTDVGFHPFFVRHGSGPYRTAPEDGAPMHLSPGDRLVAGGSIYVFDRD